MAALARLIGEGFEVQADGENILISPAKNLTDETRQWIRQHKAELLAELKRPKMPPHALLVRVANLLSVPRGYLLEQGFLDAHDLEEQAGADPLAIAALIRTSPHWIDRKAPAPTKAPPVTTESKGTPEAHAIHWSAAIASPEWLQARDAFHNHLAACPDCWAPIGRYCSEGEALRQRYQELMPTENIHGQANH